MKLIRVFVFPYAKSRFSRDTAQIICCTLKSWTLGLFRNSRFNKLSFQVPLSTLVQSLVILWSRSFYNFLTNAKCFATACAELDDPTDGSVVMSGTSVTSIATYNCMDNYHLDGPYTRVCLKSGNWSGTEPTCEPFGESYTLWLHAYIVRFLLTFRLTHAYFD